MGGAAVLLASVGQFIISMVTLRRLGYVTTQVDGLLDKRVAAAQDTGNLAGRAEMRSEQQDDRAEARSPHPPAAGRP